MYTVEIRNGREVERMATCETFSGAVILARDWHEPYGEHTIAYDMDGETIAEHAATCPDCGAAPTVTGACSIPCGE